MTRTQTSYTAPLSDVSLPTTGYRLNSIDFLRGIVMVIMALDHTRDFFHEFAFTADPLDVRTTTPLLFFTRWITHFCAPVFVFLSGVSAYLQGARKSRKELSVFLLKRGFWLVLVELTLVTFGITFDINFSLIALQVIWVIGVSMIILALMLWLPFSLILAFGMLLVFGHNTLDYYEKNMTGILPLWYSVLHRQGFFPIGGGRTLGVFYPLLPWLGLMLTGYCFGRIFRAEIETKLRNKIIIGIGLSLVLILVVLRSGNFYGDPLPWKKQPDLLFSILSFVNTQKYPPSLLYICMTIGPALIVLGLMGNMKNRVTEFFSVYGRVPFFYYILHFYILHFVMIALWMSRGHSFAEGAKGAPNFPFKFVLPGEGYNLGIVYLIWFLVVLALYPLCKWYGEYKRTHRKWWLSYL